MKKRLQKRFILSAGLAVLIVISLVVMIINIIVRISLNDRIENEIDRILESGRMENYERSFTNESYSSVLNAHFFSAFIRDDGVVDEIDLSSYPVLEESIARKIVEAAGSEKKSKGYVNWENRVFAYRSIFDYTREINGEQVKMHLLLLLDTTQSLDIIFMLRRVSIITVVIAGIAFLLVFAIVSKYAVQPIVRSYESQKRFITNASHELKTPITVISANAELLEAIGEENEWTRNIREQTVRMTDLVNELVTLSKLSEVDRPPLSDTDLSAIVEQSAGDIKPVITQKGKRLETGIADGIHIMGEQKLLMMLANILIENASKYCDEGGMISVGLTAKRRNAVLTVSNDYAAGKDVDCSRFFERFYQEDQSHTSKGKSKGFGIGLSTAQEITEMLKGSIGAGFDSGRITFTVSLPRISSKSSEH